MPEEKVNIITEQGAGVQAFAPTIVSASRATDIPAFYADWFFHRLKRGYSVWTNPFNGTASYVSYSRTKFIVFWSKNPRPLLPYLDYLAERKIGCYVQYTLNDYEREGLEKGVPPLAERIDAFKRLVDKLGYGGVVWRFDPLMLTDEISIDSLLEKVDYIGSSLVGYNEKLVFSFADISSYRKVQSNLMRSHINYREWDENGMEEFASGLAKLNAAGGWNYQLATCCEKIGLASYGIMHNRCIDDELIIRRAWQDAELMQSLNTEIVRLRPSLFGTQEIPKDAIKISDNLYAIKKRSNKDRGQRLNCGCAKSKDIGQYNTCAHLCEYCYANTSKESALANWQRHKSNPLHEKILGL